MCVSFFLFADLFWKEKEEREGGASKSRRDPIIGSDACVYGWDAKEFPLKHQYLVLLLLLDLTADCRRLSFPAALIRCFILLFGWCFWSTHNGLLLLLSPWVSVPQHENAKRWLISAMSAGQVQCIFYLGRQKRLGEAEGRRKEEKEKVSFFLSFPVDREKELRWGAAKKKSSNGCSAAVATVSINIRLLRLLDSERYE